MFVYLFDNGYAGAGDINAWGPANALNLQEGESHLDNEISIFIACNANSLRKITCFGFLLVNLYAQAASCSATGTGNWESPATWSCGQVPGAGDDVTIDSGIIVTVNANNIAAIGDLDVWGTLQFTNGSKINLSASSVVRIYSGGDITGGNGGAKLVFPSTSYSGPFATTGPFHFTNGGSGTGLLPLSLLSFYSSNQNGNVILYWKTGNESNVDFFEIESSGNGQSDWRALQTFPSMATIDNGSSYSFTDRAKTNGDLYYRLKIVDKDGKYLFSNVLLVTSYRIAALSVMPTLVHGSMKIQLPTSGSAQLSIFNTAGQLVKTLITGSDEITIDVSRLNSGTYFLRLYQGKDAYTATFFKQ